MRHHGSAKKKCQIGSNLQSPSTLTDTSIPSKLVFELILPATEHPFLKQIFFEHSIHKRTTLEQRGNEGNATWRAHTYAFTGLLLGPRNISKEKQLYGATTHSPC